MKGPFADRVFRLTFLAAGVYNLAFGVWAGIWPRSFFDLLEIPQPNYPQLWACLGMVVGVYGFLYLHAARKLEAAWPIIAVGLLGKVLGPVGMVMSFSEAWPRRLGMLCVYNDLIWWLPFVCFLIRGASFGGWIARRGAWFCAIAHVVAMVMLALVLRHGGPVEPDPAARAGHIGGHPVAWAIAWSTWMLAAGSLVGFYAWWGAQLATGDVHLASGVRRGVSAIPYLAIFLGVLGMICDLSGEAIMVLLLPERVAAHLGFADLERAFTLLCAVAANGLYTVAGILLTCLTPDLPRPIRAGMWITWVAGAVMTVAALADSMLWISISSAILFPLLIAWTLWMAAKWRGGMRRHGSEETSAGRGETG